MTYPLCDRCNQIFSPLSLEAVTDENTYFTGRAHHKTPESLQSSQRAHCPICSILDVDHVDQIVGPRNAEPEPWTAWNFDTVSHELIISGGESRYTFAVARAPPDDLLAAVERSQCTNNTSTEAQAKVAAYWMKNCLDGHSGCIANSQPLRYPTRLLDVSGDMIRLIETKGKSLHSPYATVSHCWGTAPFDVLTEDNVEIFRAGKPLSDFLPTFRDLITMSQRLEIRYLWIDCYCIVQTQSADKERQIAEMDIIYSNALINIGASAASCPYDGCFYAREPRPSELCRFNWRPTSEHAEDLYCLYNTDSDFRTLFLEGTIFKRAWVTQERLLCARMLHLGASQVYYECNETGLVSETVPYGRLPMAATHGTGFPRFDLSTLDQPSHCTESLVRKEALPTPTHDGLSPADKRTKLWWEIITVYNASSLSRPNEDKFRALGGIARRIATDTGDQYICGYFQRDLIASLTWRPQLRHSTRATEWRAPSWSWAAFDGLINRSWVVSGGNQVPLVKLLGFQVEYVDPANTYGAIKSASLELAGRLVKPTGFGEMSQFGAIRQSEWPRAFQNWSYFQNDDEDAVWRFDEERDAILPTVSGLSEGFPEENPALDGLLIRCCGKGAWRRFGTFQCRAVDLPEFREAVEERIVLN